MEKKKKRVFVLGLVALLSCDINRHDFAVPEYSIRKSGYADSRCQCSQQGNAAVYA